MHLLVDNRFSNFLGGLLHTPWCCFAYWHRDRDDVGSFVGHECTPSTKRCTRGLWLLL